MQREQAIRIAQYSPSSLIFCNNYKREVKKVMKGTIKTLKESFGFVKVEDQDKDYFFHMSEAIQFASLSIGDTVEFSEGIGRKGDTVAVSVELLEQ